MIFHSQIYNHFLLTFEMIIVIIKSIYVCDEGNLFFICVFYREPPEVEARQTQKSSNIPELMEERPFGSVEPCVVKALI